MKSVLPFYGVTSAELTGLLRPIFTEHRLADRGVWEATIRALWDEATHREERYAAINLSGMRFYRNWQDPAALQLYSYLVFTGAWWDLVDVIATNRIGPILAANREVLTPIIRDLAETDDLWLRRTAILAQLKHKAATDVELLDGVIRANLPGSPYGSDFFIRKAIGWALREYAKTDAEWVLRLVDELDDQLSPLSRREATKHLS
jgi:3-methyladenine DNA glycosylase AlkD